MPRLLLIPVFYLLTCASGWSDGYPFDPDSQRLTVPSIRLKLTGTQVQEVSAKGTITFDGGNMRLIRLHYPAAGNRADVIAATFNDNNEGLGPEDVYCIWVAPDEIAITLNDEHPKDKCPFGEPINHLIPPDADLRRSPYRLIRISPDGLIYFKGTRITLEQASALITDIARTPRPPEIQDDAWGNLTIVMPPPLTSQEISRQSTASTQTPEQIHDLLAAQGSSASVTVHRSW
ncbi:MAG: hypothetical protein EOP87_16300 [Verrucomicrobiaceae bacterium]|nr:MAG: hypothetical protein EOP87_16300 [Verrucomicrobiaceae bacterium]